MVGKLGCTFYHGLRNIKRFFNSVCLLGNFDYERLRRPLLLVGRRKWRYGEMLCVFGHIMNGLSFQGAI